MGSQYMGSPTFFKGDLADERKRYHTESIT